jgi:hypothetical protein
MTTHALLIERCLYRRFDESYDDSQSGGYRDLSLSVEVSTLPGR